VGATDEARRCQVEGLDVDLLRLALGLLGAAREAAERPVLGRAATIVLGEDLGTHDELINRERHTVGVGIKGLSDVLESGGVSLELVPNLEHLVLLLAEALPQVAALLLDGVRVHICRTGLLVVVDIKRHRSVCLLLLGG